MFLALLCRGYLPAELPPPFWSEPYGRFVAQSATFLTEDRSWGKCVAHNIPRAGHARRPLDIPNPYWFAKLARTLTDHEREVHEHTVKSGYSVTRPRRDHTGHRAFVYRLSYSPGGQPPSLEPVRSSVCPTGRHPTLLPLRLYPLDTLGIPWQRLGQVEH